MKNGRYIVLQYPLYNMGLNELHEIIHNTQEALSSYIVVAIPSSVNWFDMSKEELMQVRGMLDWVLEKKNDTNSEAGTRS